MQRHGNVRAVAHDVLATRFRKDAQREPAAQSQQMTNLVRELDPQLPSAASAHREVRLPRLSLGELRLRCRDVVTQAWDFCDLCGSQYKYKSPCARGRGGAPHRDGSCAIGQKDDSALRRDFDRNRCLEGSVSLWNASLLAVLMAAKSGNRAPSSTACDESNRAQQQHCPHAHPGNNVRCHAVEGARARSSYLASRAMGSGSGWSLLALSACHHPERRKCPDCRC